MPVIKVEMFKGRTRDQKRELVKGITDVFLNTCGGKPEALQIVIQDVEKENWGAGGELCSDKFPDGEILVTTIKPKY